MFLLQAPLATRSDLPAPVAFELFWSLPIELRRYVLSRFLTDSKTLEKILKFTKSVDSDIRSDSFRCRQFSRPRTRRPVRCASLSQANPAMRRSFLAELAGVHVERNAARIIADCDGEPLAAALKALGVPRVRFEEIIQGISAVAGVRFTRRSKSRGIAGSFRYPVIQQGSRPADLLGLGRFPKRSL